MLDFIATWASHGNFQQIHKDGRETVDGIVLPPYIELRNQAQKIIEGFLIVDRIGGWGEIWEPEDEPYFKAASKWPGELKLEAKIGSSHHLEWWITWRIAADHEGLGHSGAYMSPTLALAHMIAACEEHEKEIRAEMLELTGGHA